VKRIRRVVACQGTIQLVAALAAMEHDAAKRGPGYEYEDHLVICNLLPPGQSEEEFASIIEQMAHRAHRWKAVKFISSETVARFSRTWVFQDVSRVFPLVYAAVGVSETDQVYLARSGQLTNRLFINAYSPAQKICYGDAIGIYFTRLYYRAPAETWLTGAALYRDHFQQFALKQWQRIIFRLQQWGRLEPSLRPIECDQGYFLLPDIMGETPRMPTETIDLEVVRKAFEPLREFVPEALYERLREQLGSDPVVILLTSNFSEWKRMDLAAEVAAYEEYLTRREYAPGTVLVIKPHPRDSKAKLQELQRRLAPTFKRVILLDDLAFFYTPFELIYERLCQDLPSYERRPEVLSVSTACLSLAALYGARCGIGFGEEIVRRYFPPEFARSRIEHEAILIHALDRIESGLVQNRNGAAELVTT